MPVSATSTATSARSVAFIGLTCALMAVSAWITVPLGPVPFTLQVFVMVFAILVLEPRDAIMAIVLYLLAGAVGLPVFSGMRGGVGILAGPTGGFLWGYAVGGLAAIALRQVLRPSKPRAQLVADVACAVVFLLCCYLCGWIQLAAVADMDLPAAFAVGIAPFILIDAAKIAVAIGIAQAVRPVVRPAAPSLSS